MKIGFKGKVTKTKNLPFETLILQYGQCEAQNHSFLVKDLLEHFLLFHPQVNQEELVQQKPIDTYNNK